MTKSDRGTPLTISLQIPTYWTPEQAFAVFELVDELRETIWRCYALQLQQEYRDQRRHHDADYDPIEPTICRSDLQSNSKGPIGPFRCDCTTFARIHTATNNTCAASEGEVQSRSARRRLIAVRTPVSAAAATFGGALSG